MFIFNGIHMPLWSHHFTFRVTVRTCALKKSGPIMTKQTTTDNAKKRTGDAQAKRSRVYRFLASCRSIIYVCANTFMLCHFVYS